MSWEGGREGGVGGRVGTEGGGREGGNGGRWEGREGGGRGGEGQGAKHMATTCPRKAILSVGQV